MPCKFWSESYSHCGLSKGQFPKNEHASDTVESAPSASDNSQSVAALEAAVHGWFGKYTNFDITLVMARDLRKRLNAANNAALHTFSKRWLQCLHTKGRFDIWRHKVSKSGSIL